MLGFEGTKIPREYLGMTTFIVELL